MEFRFQYLNPYSGEPLRPLAFPVSDDVIEPPTQLKDKDYLPLNSATPAYIDVLKYSQRPVYPPIVRIIAGAKEATPPERKANVIEGCIPFETRIEPSEYLIGQSVQDWFSFGKDGSQVQVQALPIPVERSFPSSSSKRLYSFGIPHVAEQAPPSPIVRERKTAPQPKMNRCNLCEMTFLRRKAYKDHMLGEHQIVVGPAYVEKSKAVVCNNNNNNNNNIEKIKME